mmetsp:Transcript_6/g.27  ORF Transcript_6/g.27 Transcript_6/m.27 type:complete len:91 (-) Transcript_6:180-452(-)
MPFFLLWDFLVAPEEEEMEDRGDTEPLVRLELVAEYLVELVEPGLFMYTFAGGAGPSKPHSSDECGVSGPHLTLRLDKVLLTGRSNAFKS